MKADVVIIDGMMLDAITSENKKLHKELQLAKDRMEAYDKERHLQAEMAREYARRLEQKITENMELSKKCVYYDELTNLLIRENNELNEKIKKQKEVEANLWEWIESNVKPPEDLDYDDMEEFN